jgi:hypothetical protein
VREAFYGIGKALFCAKGICEQEKLMLLKAPHIKIFSFFSVEEKVCAILQKKTRTKHNKYNLVMRNL